MVVRALVWLLYVVTGVAIVSIVGFLLGPGIYWVGRVTLWFFNIPHEETLSDLMGTWMVGALTSVGVPFITLFFASVGYDFWERIEK